MQIARSAAFACLISTLTISMSRAASETVVYDFGPFAPPAYVEPASGREPDAGLLSTKGGRVFYGTAAEGGMLADGRDAYGTLFKITRAAGSASSATFSVLHSFDPVTEGGIPDGTPATDGKSLFDALDTGPGSGGGSIYQWTPTAGGTTGGKLTILHFFGSPGDGKLPTGTLYRAADGTLYGTTSFDSSGSNGLVFQLKPPVAGQTTWAYSILHTFTGADGSGPRGGLVQDASGTLYGATTLGGPAGRGTVFSLRPPAAGQTSWTETILAGFEATGAPSEPNASLLFDNAGAIYATSAYGGTSNQGTVFKLTPPASPGAAWETTLLLSFSGSNGSQPFAPLIANAQGVLYGTTSYGGAHNRGIVFSLTPPAAGSTVWQEANLVDFLAGPAPRGQSPIGGLTFTANGQLAGMTPGSGLNNTGVIYLVKP